MLTFGSLFAGIGGFDRGFDTAGLICRWQVELDDACNRVLQRHWPEVKRYDDVRTVGTANLEPVDLICGGFPCQDVSVAGQRRGLAGERSGLWFEFHRILAECRPRWVVIENVPGLLSSNGGSDFAAILRGLVELGYGAAWRILDLQHFGIPQRRRRVFIVGHLGGGRAAQVLFEREGGGWHPTPSREAGPRTAATITSGIGVTGNAPGRRREDDVNLVACLNSGGNSGGFRTEPGEHLVCAALSLRGREGGSTAELGGDVANALRASQGGGDKAYIAYTLRSEGFDGSEDGTGRGVPIVVQGGAQQDQFCDPEGIAPTLAHSSNSHQGHHEPKVVYGCSINQRREGRLRDVHGSLNGQRSATQFDGVLEHMAVRRLTPLECTRLQSFPDDWLDIDGLSDSAKYRMLGNAVPPIIPEWLGRRILAACEARDD